MEHSLNENCKFVALIPSYKPDEHLVQLVEELHRESILCLVVDDGSGEQFDDVYGRIETMAKVVRSPKNQGKGAALKFGMSNLLSLYPDCTHFITADSDGQHKVKDILKVRDALSEGAVMVLTERDFKGKIPRRSMFGNILSRWVYCILTGHYLSDNQSGLRGFAVSELDWLTQVAGNKYDYEINMLYYADCQHVPIDLVPVESVYIDGNKSSHFNPVADTIRIYRRLFISSIGALIAGLVTVILMILATIYFGYEYCFFTVPSIGAMGLFINLGVDALKFVKIHYRDGGRTLLYAAFRYTYYTFGCMLAGRFLPELPLVIAFLILVLIAVPIRFYLYQFLFSRIFFKGKLNGRKTN